jgi:Domain of unknown function (DUF4386)
VKASISKPDQSLARTCGLLYFLMMATVGLHFSISGNFSGGSPAEMFAKLQANQGSYRFAILGGAAGYIIFLLLGVSVYGLFRPVQKAAATVMLTFVGIHTAISLAAIARQLDALALVRDPILANSGTAGQVALSVLGFNSMFRLSMIFSGLWLIPLGLLVYRCGFIPKFVGVFHMLGSVFYVMTFAGWVMDPGYDASLAGRIIGTVFGVPSLIGEASTCIFLLIAGFRRTTRTLS